MTNYTSLKLAKALGLIVLSGLSGASSAQNPANSFNWSQAGPVYNAGRSRNMIVDQRDATHNTLYTGSASSGVYKSIDGGSNWRSINNLTNVLNISYMAQTAGNDILAATGEGFLRPGQKAKAQIGTGLYTLKDSTLYSIASATMVGTVINRVACSPKSNVVAIATNKGIMIGTVSGTNAVTFTVAVPPPNSLASGQDVKFDSHGRLYCSIGSEVNNTVDTKIWQSNDTIAYDKSTFNDITPTGVLSDMHYGRIELAIAPLNDQVIYASIANKATNPVGNSSDLKGLLVTYDAGANWTLIHKGSAQLDPLTNGANVSSGDYAQVIKVVPTSADQLIIGSFSVSVYSRGPGSTNSNIIPVWGGLGSPYALNTPLYLHENIHDIEIVRTGTNTTLYFVTDAGIYRSTDVLSGTLPSFQPFYKGLVTGQFNSVSIETFPASSNSATAQNGETILANDGFAGGTDGNGLTYFSGSYPLASQEINYLSGEIGAVQYSKILPGAILISTGSDSYGLIYRSSNIQNNAPTLVTVNSYTGTLSQITPATNAFYNGNGYITSPYVASGTPFKLWENYGQVSVSPDSMVFYNDSIQVSSTIQGLATLTTQTTFTFSPGRPNKYALIDSIAIRTNTVVYQVNATHSPAFLVSDKKDIFVKLSNNYTVSPTITSPPVSQLFGPASAAGVTLNATSGLDNISVTFSTPPFATRTLQTYPNVPDPSVFYVVFATVFYKYNIHDTVSVIDNSISTHEKTYKFPLAQSLRWSKIATNGSKPVAQSTNPPQKTTATESARLALGYNGVGNANVTGIVVSKAPLNLNDPLSFIRVSQNGALTTNSLGASINSTITLHGKPFLIEWSHGGTELYFAAESGDSSWLYRVSNLYTLMDLTPNSYFGKINTDIFSYGTGGATASNPYLSNLPNLNSPYRTTLLGSFLKPITGIAITNNDTALALSFADPTGTIVMYSGRNIRTADFSNINFTSKNGTGLSNVVTYCSMMEKDDNRKVFLGTDKGVYYTADITAASPRWDSINNGQLPRIRVLDIEQQTLDASQCYNSGQIFVATYGRGVWTNKKYYAPDVVSVQELQMAKKENNLKVYPNPTDGKVYLGFSSVSGESAVLQVMDINGRLMKSESLGKLYTSETTYIFDASDLNSGMYIVNILSDAGIRRVSKLVVTK